MGEIFTIAGLIFVLTLVGIVVGLGVIKIRGEVKE
jgi:hypothetical protein